MMKRILAVSVMVSCSLTRLAAQGTTPLEFDVSSVKPAPERDIREVTRRPPPGQWKLLSVTLQNAIIIAYPAFRLPGLVVGGPEWINETRFDLQGRMSPTATHVDVETMTRRLLAERFGLRTHTERRTLDVYVLTVATPGKLGPGLTPARTACVTWRLTGGRMPDECAVYRAGSGGSATSVATMSDFITAMTLWALAPPSGGFVNAIDRPVVDKTGLEGYFQMIGPSPLAGGRIGADVNGSFFTLMEEQLGLKLTRAREMVDVLVIDAASMPEPD